MHTALFLPALFAAAVAASLCYAPVRHEKLTVARSAHNMRAGPVRLCGRAVCDDGGPFNALGVSLFWGAWGYKFDTGRLEKNLAAIAGTADYIRVIGDVGPDGWSDRETNPSWPDYRRIVERLTDVAWDKYGLRVEWTIFGGSRHVPTAAARDALVDLFADVANSRPEKVFAIEIANEGWQTFPNGDADEMRRLARRLAERTSTLVAITAPNGGDTAATCRLYADSAADVATQHYDRDPGDHGFRPTRQPWGYPGEYDAQGKCAGKLPKTAFNNEPRGPQSSVAATDDPLLLVMDYVTTFVSQNAAYVLHTGAGVRGGGREDVARGRAANLRDVPRFHEILAALKAAKRYLPEGLAGWQRHEVQSSSFPFAGFDDAMVNGSIVGAYMATKDAELTGVVLGITRPVRLTAKRGMRLQLLHPVTGKILRSLQLRAGDRFEIRDWPRTHAGNAGAVVVRGRFR